MFGSRYRCAVCIENNFVCNNAPGKRARNGSTGRQQSGLLAAAFLVDLIS
jgi:hypothetical protein